MIELDSATVVILLTSSLAMMIFAVFLILRVSWRLRRIEYLISEINGTPREPAPIPSATETVAGGAFEMFLAEDPARRRLTKGEQFTAYRQWRQEKGMNWSNS